MKQYIVEFTLPNQLNNDFMSLVPDQQKRVAELFHESVLVSYTLTLDRSKLWATMKATDEIEVIEIVNSFPLSEYMTYEVSELFFNEVFHSTLPAISLN